MGMGRKARKLCLSSPLPKLATELVELLGEEGSDGRYLSRLSHITSPTKEETWIEEERGRMRKEEGGGFRRFVGVG